MFVIGAGGVAGLALAAGGVWMLVGSRRRTRRAVGRGVVGSEPSTYATNTTRAARGGSAVGKLSPRDHPFKKHSTHGAATTTGPLSAAKQKRHLSSSNNPLWAAAAAHKG